MLTYDHPSVDDAKLSIDQKEPAETVEAKNERALAAIGIQTPIKETATEALRAKLGSEPGTPVPETTIEAPGPIPVEIEDKMAAASEQNSENAGAVPGKKPRAPRTVKSDVEYFLADGKGPFATVQLAFDALGVPVGPGRPTHNRYDRLGKKDWQLKIIEKPKRHG